MFRNFIGTEMGIITDWYVSVVINNFEEIFLLGTDAIYVPDEGKYLSPSWN